MVNRKITSDNITGSYSHIKKIVKYFIKHVNTGQIIESINLKKLLQPFYVDSQKSPRCDRIESHTKTTTQLAIKRLTLVSLDTQSNKLNDIIPDCATITS